MNFFIGAWRVGRWLTTPVRRWPIHTCICMCICLGTCTESIDALISLNRSKEKVNPNKNQTTEEQYSLNDALFRR